MPSSRNPIVFSRATGKVRRPVESHNPPASVFWMLGSPAYVTRHGTATQNLTLCSCSNKLFQNLSFLPYKFRMKKKSNYHKTFLVDCAIYLWVLGEKRGGCGIMQPWVISGSVLECWQVLAIHQNTTSFSAHVSTQLPSPLILLLIGVVRDDHNILPIIITFGLLGSSVYSLLRAGWGHPRGGRNICKAPRPFNA